MDNPKDVLLPEKVLDDIFEHTGSDKGRGYIICYITENRNISVHHKTSSSVERLALTKGLESFLENQEAETENFQE